MIRIMRMLRRAAPAFLIALLLIAASCSQIAQKEDDRKEVGRQLTDAYYSCVRTSFASQRPTMVDRNMAIDQAFAVCQTEESKLEAFENPQHLDVSTAGISRRRNTLKEELLRR
jgi:methylthioribose-1-phosphate isomerase